EDDGVRGSRSRCDGRRGGRLAPPRARGAARTTLRGGPRPLRPRARGTPGRPAGPGARRHGRVLETPRARRRRVRPGGSADAPLRRAGVGPQAVTSAGGYYDPGSKTSYLFSQPHDSSTRLLVLHELTHQFQAKATLENELVRSPGWHKEGLAEHFGFHRRVAG